MDVGLIGFGYWGANYLRVLSELHDTNLMYVCDSDGDKLTNLAGKGYVLTSDVRRVAEDSVIDAVVIATPASTHFALAKLMLESDKHVLVEKPLTMNYQEAIKLSELAREVNKVLMTGHVYCYNPAVNNIKRLLEHRGLGRLYYGVGLRMGLGPIRNDASCTWDLATHDIAMLDYLLCKLPAYVSAQAISFLQRERIYDYSTIQLTYDDGFQFSLTVSWYSAEKIRSWYLVGSDRMLRFDDMNKRAPITIYNKSASLISTDPTKRYNVVIREGDTLAPYIRQEEPLLLQVKHFIECVRTGKKPLTGGEQGVRVVKVLEAMEESAKKRGSPVEMEQKNEHK